MIFKSKHSLFFLMVLCFAGSAITTLILHTMLSFHLIVSSFILLIFLIKKVYFGNIRSIVCKDQEIEIHYEKIKRILYKDIQPALLKVDEPRRLNSRQKQREINCVLIIENNESITIPYISFTKDLYDILQYIHERNPNVFLDPISYMGKKDFYQTLSKIKACEIKPMKFIRNELRR